MINWAAWIVTAGSSPHTRGARRADRGCGVDGGIIPAYAGSTRGVWRSARGSWDHPRIRGEHEVAHREARRLRGSSPHTRGALIDFHGRYLLGRIIPAYAGSTGTCSAGRRLGRWIIPAYAGSTSAAGRRARPPADHPRIRGEHHDRRCAVQRRRGSSPHTRGALEVPDTVSILWTDHPRIRGEHVTSWGGPESGCGSSPHTRGAPTRQVKSAYDDRIIPAYAGSTSSSRG